MHPLRATRLVLAAPAVVVVLLCLAAPTATLDALDVPGEHPAALARSQGYLGEHHWATTEDGYLLSLFRIRNETATRATRKSAVLVMPGLACNAAIWVLLGPGKALAYLLADRGYDVWLGNYRGGMYARRHVNLTDQDAAFWDFSFDDIGRLDVPALLQEVSARSGRRRVAYIGHSMGASVLTVMASARPTVRLLDRISRAYLLAPAAYMGHASQPAVYGSAGAVSTLHGSLGLFASGEIPLNSWWVRAARLGVCSSAVATPLCVLLGGVYVGHDSEQISQADVPFFLSYIPDSISMKNVLHFTQHFGRDRDFRRFDYGAEGNLRTYAREDAPEYNVSKSTFPASVYYGENDFLVSTKDVLAFADTLPNVIRLPYRIPYDKFTHIDFFLAKDAKALLYDQLIKDLDEDEGKFVNS